MKHSDMTTRRIGLDARKASKLIKGGGTQGVDHFNLPQNIAITD